MTPILYSFRRCPYAMRARLAIARAGIEVELREVVLRDKPPEFLDASPSATVPCLVTENETIDESLDIMKWALAINDPDNWCAIPSGTSAAGQPFARPRGGSDPGLDPENWRDMPEAGHRLIDRADGPFKQALDRTKYPNRYPDEDPDENRALAAQFLTDLDSQITDWIFDAPTLADFAILPFVRQFAFIDKDWFDAQAWPNLQRWLDRFLQSDLFAQIMPKYPQWKAGDAVTAFPPRPSS